MDILINGVPAGGSGSLPAGSIGHVLVGTGPGTPPAYTQNLDQLTGVTAQFVMSCPQGKVRSNALIIAERPFANQGAENVGELVNITDANVGTPGGLVTAGGGSNHVLARWDGTNWKVVA